MTFILSLVLAAAIGLLAWKRREWALALVAAGTPLYVARFSIAGIPMTALELIILIVFGVWCMRLLLDKSERDYAIQLLKLRSVRIAYVMSLFLIAASLMALLVTPDFTSGLGLWKAYIIEPILFFIVAIHTFRSVKQFRAIGIALLVSGSLVAVLALIQGATGFAIPEPWDALPDRRATAHYGYPNAVGLFLAPLLTLALGWLIHGWKQLSSQGRRALIVASTLLFTALLAARVEGALVGVAAAVFVMLLFTTRARWYAVGAAALGLIAGFAIEPVRRILLFQDTSGDVRLALWRGTWNLLSDLPWFGAGLSGFPLTYDIYRLDQHVELLQYPHNIFLNFWSELGFAGLVWIILVLVLVVWALLKSRKRTTANSQAATAHWPLTVLAIFVTIVVYGLVDVPVMKNDLSLLFALWLSMVAVLSIVRSKKNT